MVLKGPLPLLNNDTTSSSQTSVSLPSLSSFSLPRPFVWFQLSLGNLWEGWQIMTLSLCILSQVQGRHRNPIEIKNTLMSLAKLGRSMWLPPGCPPSLYLGTYLSQNEICRANGHSAGHREEDIVPLPTHTGTGLPLAGCYECACPLHADSDAEEPQMG